MGSSQTTFPYTFLSRNLSGTPACASLCSQGRLRGFHSRSVFGCGAPPRPRAVHVEHVSPSRLLLHAQNGFPRAQQGAHEVGGNHRLQLGVAALDERLRTRVGPRIVDLRKVRDLVI